VIVAALVINLITLIVVVFLSREFVAKHIFKKDIATSSYYRTFTNNIVPSFACGALLATTVFLVLPEALSLMTAHYAEGSSSATEIHDDGHSSHRHRFLQDDHEDHEGHGDESSAVWRFGTCIIGGFLIPVLTSAIFPHRHYDESVESMPEGCLTPGFSETEHFQLEAHGQKPADQCCP